MTKSDRLARWAAVVALSTACTARGTDPGTDELSVESLQAAPTLASVAPGQSAATPAAPTASPPGGAPAPAGAPAATAGEPAAGQPAAGQPAEQPEQPAAAKLPVTPPEPFSGVVTTRDHRVVPAEFQARVRQVYVHAGQSVHAGEPIIKLDDAEVVKELEQNKGAEAQGDADVRKAGVDVADARRQLELEKRLGKKGAASKEQIRQKEIEVRRAEALLSSAEANYRRATAAREQLEARLGKTVLYAPIDGIVSMIRVKESDMAQQGMAVAHVFNPSDLWLRFAAEPEYRELVRPGAHVTVQVGGVTVFNAVVTNVTLDLEPPNQFLVVDADIDDQSVDKNAVRVGSLCRVTVSAGAPVTASAR